MRKSSLLALLFWLLAGSVRAWFPHGDSSAPPVLIAPNAVTSATLEQWFQGDGGCLNGSASACTNGQTVATWQDQSGNAFHSTVAGSPACTSGPVYTTNQLNGLAGLAWAGTSGQCLHNTYNGDPGTIIVVSFTVPRSGGLEYRYLLSAASAQTQYAYAFAPAGQVPTAINTDAFNVTTRSYLHGTSASNSAVTWASYASHQHMVWDISVITNDGTTIKQYSGTTLHNQMAIPGGATALAPTGGQYIGASPYGGTLFNAYSGTVVQVITYNGAISSDDQSGVVAWLRDKYGLTDGSPAAPSYFMTANNQQLVGGVQPYSDLAAYAFYSTDGIHFPQQAPINCVPHFESGQPFGAFLGLIFLHDTNGNLVKYNGLYWAMSASTPYPSDIFPHYNIEFYTTSDLISCTWAGSYAATGFSGAQSGVYNNDWFIDPLNGNAVAFMFNGSNTEQAGTSEKEYIVPITLNANGTFTTGTQAQMTGSALPASYYAGQINLVGSTYYFGITDFPATGAIKIYTSSSPYSGYNTLAGTYAQHSGGPVDWPEWLQTSGSGIYYENENNPAGESYATYSDGVLGTSVLSAFTDMTKAVSTWPSNGTVNFWPQAMYVYRLPAVILP